MGRKLSVRCLPQLHELGVTLVEQPVPSWNNAAMARLRARPGTPPLLADENVFTTHDMMAVGSAGAADAVSLKLVKHAGLLGLKQVAAVAEACGVALYGGCLLESSIGAAAHLQAFATLRELAWGCEHFGPQILTGDLVSLCHKVLVRFRWIAYRARLMVLEANRGFFIRHAWKRITPSRLCRGVDPLARAR